MRIDMVVCERCKKQYRKDAFNECPYCTGQSSVGCEINLAVDEGERFTETVELSGGQTANDNRVFPATEPPRYNDSVGDGVGQTAPPPEIYYTDPVGDGYRPTGAPERYIDTVDNMKPTAPPRDQQKKEEERFPPTTPDFMIDPIPTPAPAPQPQPNPNINSFITVPVGEVREPVVGWLVAIDGKMKGKDFSIKGASATIGRGESNKIRITEDVKVSREVNCTIRYDYRKMRYRIVPNTVITNPVRLNDEEIDVPQQLRAYDRIEIGGTTFLFVPLCGQQFGWGEERR